MNDKAQACGSVSSTEFGPVRFSGLVTEHPAGNYVSYEAFSTLRDAARALYNATIAEPGVRLTTHSQELRDVAKSAGEDLRALLLATAPNTEGKRPAQGTDAGPV